MGKTRVLFKKIRDTKGIFHVKMASIKDRNGMDLIEAEDIRLHHLSWSSLPIFHRKVKLCSRVSGGQGMGWGFPLFFHYPGMLALSDLD